MTYGVSTQPRPPTDAAKILHDAGIRVVVVGIGNRINRDKLLSMVKDSTDFYTAQDFDKLVSDSFITSVVVCGKSSSKP